MPKGVYTRKPRRTICDDLKDYVLNGKHGTTCEPWWGYINDARGGRGYLHAYGCFGAAAVDKVPSIASRVALGFKLNREIKPDHLAIHSCDNPSCVNPNHIREGTHKDNARDMMLRERSKSGFTNKQILGIYKRLERGESLRAIAKRFGVQMPAIWKISKQRTWTHVAWNVDAAKMKAARKKTLDRNRPRGVKNGSSKLTNRKVVMIRKRHKRGETQASIAKHYGISTTTLASVLQKKTWKHVK